MNTIKKGSRGEDVKKLQQLLGIKNCDGIFGAVTETELKKFQSTHVGIDGKKLSVDGICGPATWNALMATTSKPASSSSPIKINHQPSSYLCQKKAGRSIKYIVVHYTETHTSRSGSAMNVIKYWAKQPVGKRKSADFVVDDENIIQINPDIRNNYCWHVGGNVETGNGGATLHNTAQNNNCIGIEICSTLAPGTTEKKSNHAGWSYTPAVLDNAVKLIRYLMSEYNIPIDRVIRHYDVTGKLCPGIIGWNDATIVDAEKGTKTTQKNNSQKWLEFKKRLV